MSNPVFEDELKRRLDGAMAREKERLQQARHRRDVAAMVDFTSNLLSLVGRAKGVRYMPVSNSLAQHGAAYATALQRYGETMKDYKGVIAGNLLRERLAAGKRAAIQTVPKQPPGRLAKSVSSIIDRTRVNKVLDKSRTNKSNDYVFGKFI